MPDGSAAQSLIEAFLELRLELERHFTARLRSRDAARGLVQDIYVRIAQRPPTQVDNPAAYLYRLGGNLMLDQIRGERRSQRRALAWSEVHTPLSGGEAAAEEPSAETQVMAREELALVLAAVRELPPQAREAFRLHKLEGLSHAETASALGVSRSSVEKYLMTCLRRIQARLVP